VGQLLPDSTGTSKESYPMARSDSGSSGSTHTTKNSKIKMDSRFRGNDVKTKSTAARKRKPKSASPRVQAEERKPKSASPRAQAQERKPKSASLRAQAAKRTRQGASKARRGRYFSIR
jgi:hypothetical protein